MIPLCTDKCELLSMYMYDFLKQSNPLPRRAFSLREQKLGRLKISICQSRGSTLATLSNTSIRGKVLDVGSFTRPVLQTIYTADSHVVRVKS